MKKISMSLDEYNADLYNAKLSGLSMSKDTLNRLSEIRADLSSARSSDEVYRVNVKLHELIKELEK